jgi:hypothetical protein
MAERPAPTPIRMQTIKRKVCAPEAIGELNISNSVIGKAVNECNLWSKITRRTFGSKYRGKKNRPYQMACFCT